MVNFFYAMGNHSQVNYPVRRLVLMLFLTKKMYRDPSLELSQRSNEGHKLCIREEVLEVIS